ncbi:Wip1p NDAI_0A04510 [Naumovozyma dairenensis CBS 421]|uniref:Uncharacterized protein n=1 Tax=Naumovozyma dairenensis (strain ATCC 10597 / BCRC 20456 / CBS 421 / NBRC 0211 / NRRL Y-12639) TaxID=1071378 RepID=G0W469_NAUDC|nr:hypothetical protein NDAI_0A04510 [Naumovozyma dairenensis CBS 421]CCD22607.1 hypothetical protein NDAI_0A04510 [Naumovozyma dairenensis CBS 421]
MSPNLEESLSEYLIRELSKQGDLIEPDSQSKLLLACTYQELLKKIILRAAAIARLNHSAEVLPIHLERAMEEIMNK